MSEEKSKHVFPLIIATLVVVALLMYVLFFQVRQTEVAVVTMFGKPTGQTYDKPGLYPKWPWPIQDVYRFDKRIQIFDGNLYETLTSDDQVVLVTEMVGWRIVDAKRFLETVGSVARAKALLKPLVSDAKTKVVGQYRFSDMVSAREEGAKAKQKQKELLKHGEMEEKMKGLVNDALNRLSQKWGIKLVMVKLKRIGLPQTVRDKVVGRMKAERERETKEILKAGESASNTIKRNADAASEAALAIASREAAAIRGKGRAEAAHYYKILNEKPELAIFLQKIKALAQVKEKLTLFVDDSMPPFDILRKESVRGAAAEAAGGAPSKGRAEKPSAKTSAKTK